MTARLRMCMRRLTIYLCLPVCREELGHTEVSPRLPPSVLRTSWRRTCKLYFYILYIICKLYLYQILYVYRPPLVVALELEVAGRGVAEVVVASRGGDLPLRPLQAGTDLPATGTSQQLSGALVHSGVSGGEILESNIKSNQVKSIQTSLNIHLRNKYFFQAFSAEPSFFSNNKHDQVAPCTRPLCSVWWGHIVSPWCCEVPTPVAPPPAPHERPRHD